MKCFPKSERVEGANVASGITCARVVMRQQRIVYWVFGCGSEVYTGLALKK